MEIMTMEDSMNSLKMKIWGREFELGIAFNVFEGEEVTDAQKNAWDLFLKANASNIVDDEKSAESQNQNNETKIAPTPIDISKPEVEEYCLDNSNGNEIDEPITNIFKYVIPKYFLVDCFGEEQRIVALMCNFKFDMEHGLSVVFKNEKFDEVGDKGLAF